MPANEKGHVVLNGKPYILIEESYEKRAQQPFTARFATGDPTEGDNSFWQFLSQKGWVSENQEIFQTTTNYRQSSGWDMRLGRPRIGYGIETLPLLNAIASPYSLIGAHTLDDFASGSVDWAKWNDGDPSSGTYDWNYLDSWWPVVHPPRWAGIACQDGLPGALVQGSEYGALSGLWEDPNPALITHPAGGSAYSDAGQAAAVPARAASTGIGPAPFTGRPSTTHKAAGSSGVYTEVTSYLGQIGMTGLSLAASGGTFAFDLFVPNSANRIHHGIAFMMNAAGGGYILETSGSGMTTWKLFKTTKSNAWDTGADTLLVTWTATSKVNTITLCEIAVSSLGVFTCKQDGTPLAGSVTDTTYLTGNCIRFTTAYDPAGSPSVGRFVIPASAASASASSGKFIRYNNQLILAYNANGLTAFTLTNLIARSQSSNLPAITHINARDVCVWSRDGDPSGGLNSITGVNTFLCAVSGTTLNIYSGTTIAYTVSLASTGGLIIPINSTTLLILGTSAENSGLLIGTRLIFTANTWTVSTTENFHLDGGVAGQMVNSYAFDDNGVLYFASNDCSGTPGGIPSRLYQITPADQLASKPTISSTTTIPDFVIRGIAGLANSLNQFKPFAIYVLGAYIEGNASYPSVMRYPGQVVYKSWKGRPLSGGTQGELFNLGIATFGAGAKNIRFLSQTDDNTWDPVVELDVDQLMREVASFNSGQFAYNNPNTIAITEWNGRFYCLNAQAGTIQRTTGIRGGLGVAFDAANPLGSCIVKLSDMGRNTSLINKSLFACYLEVSDPLISSTSWSVYVDALTGKSWSVGNNDLVITINGRVVGVAANIINPAIGAELAPTLMVLNTGGLYRVEMILPFELTASIFTPKVIANQVNTWTGYLKFLMLKYVPTQFKKRAWGFGIRATKHLKVIDGSRESRTPAVLLSDIEAAWANNTPMTFLDVDGAIYNVIVTDFKQKRPLLATSRQADNESFVFIEVLEI